MLPFGSKREIDVALRLDWRRPPRRLCLGPGEIHIWQADLDATAGLERWRGVLSAAELHRASRFYSARDGDRFIARRGVLREILARYLDDRPDALEFQCEAHGKPALASLRRDTSPHFNVSHSQNLALYAISLDSRVGIDVEWVRANCDVLPVAQLCFGGDEAHRLSRLAGEEQSAAFFRLWTRLEACLKATGAGLAGLQREKGDGRGHHLPDGKWPSAEWSILEGLEPRPGFVAAVVTEREGCRLCCWEHSLAESDSCRAAAQVGAGIGAGGEANN